MRRVQVCVVAFLVILRAGEATTQASKDSEARGTDPVEWGPEQNGVRTGLVTLESEFFLGKPILVRLEMQNLGNRVIQYDSQQVAVNASMTVERSDGVNAPFIVTNVQTGGGPRPLNPGDRVVLFKSLDIAAQYLLTSPGTYTVRFRGQDKAFGEVDIPTSNAITIRVADGPVQPSRLIARRLVDTVQMSGWRVGIVEEGSVVPLGRSLSNGATFALSRGGRTKEDALRVMIWVTASPSALEPSKQDAPRGRTAEPIGRCAWGEVYLWSGAATEEELRTVREMIATALKIEER